MARAFDFSAEEGEDLGSQQALVSLLDGSLGIRALIDFSMLAVEAGVRDEASILFYFTWK